MFSKLTLGFHSIVNCSKSSTYVEVIAEPLDIHYDGGPRLSISKFKDKMGFGDDEITDFSMGLGTSGDFSQGVLALGISRLTGYSLLEQLVEQNHANSRAYSFSLDRNAMSGNLLFGAVDTSAFDKPFQRIRAQPALSSYKGLAVDLSSVRYKPRGGGHLEDLGPQKDLPRIRIQPTEMLSNFPSGLAKTIYTVAGAEYDSISGLATTLCSGAKSSAEELVLGLGDNGNATIRVSFADLIIPREMVPPDAANVNQTDDTCLFAIQSISHTGNPDYADSGWWSIGGILLRNTYMAFDLVNHEVALAPARFSDREGSTGNVKSFSGYGSRIPQSEDAEPPVCSDWTCRDDSDLPSSGYVPSKYRLPSTTIVLIVLPTVAVLGISVSIMWCLWRRGSCCFRGRKKMAGARRAPAWTMAPIHPPRPPPPYAPGTISPQLPRFDGTAPAGDGAATAVSSAYWAPGEPLQPPSYDQAANPPVHLLEANHSRDRPACPPPSPPAPPSADLPAVPPVPARFPAVDVNTSSSEPESPKPVETEK